MTDLIMDSKQKWFTLKGILVTRHRLLNYGGLLMDVNYKIPRTGETGRVLFYIPWGGTVKDRKTLESRHIWKNIDSVVRSNIISAVSEMVEHIVR